MFYATHLYKIHENQWTVKMWSLLQIHVLVLCTCGLAIDYHGHQVYRVIPADDYQMLSLQDMMEADLELDFWREPLCVSCHVNVQVPPAKCENFAKTLDDLQITYHLIIVDLQAVIDDHLAANQARKDVAPFYNFTYYMQWDEMEAWLGEKADECGTRCNLFSIGLSYEGRNLPVVRIEGTVGKRQDKQDVWVDGGIHGNEWLGHHTAAYFIEQLVDGYGRDEKTTTLLDKYNIYIMPCMNPDGYEYTWSTDRTWRKTRQPTSETCFGTDCNRNFDFMWNTIGTDPDPCSNRYPGSAAWSEPEAKAVGEYIQNTTDAVFVAYVTLHTYGQYLLGPYGYTCDRVDEHDELMRVAERASLAIQGVHGLEFISGSSCEVFNVSSGTSRDWAHGVMGIDYEYTIELRDKDSHIQPPTEIIPAGEETWAGFVEMMAAIDERPYRERQ